MPIWNRRRSKLILPILCAVISAAIAGISLKPAAGGWPEIQSHGATYALEEPAWLKSSESLAILWRPIGATTPLTYQRMDSIESPVDLLPYADLEPRRWQAVPADEGMNHLVWLEKNDRLRSALLDAQGQTIRGPIELASNVKPGFAILEQRDHSVMVFWINQRQDQAAALQIDPAGRPGPVQNPITGRVSFLAAGIDVGHENQMTLAWLSSSTPREWTINYQTFHSSGLEINTSETLYRFTLNADESIASFSLGMDHTHNYIFWSLHNAQSPDTERAFVLALPSSDLTVTEILLPEQFTPSRRLTGNGLNIGRIQPVTQLPDSPAALRWLRPAHDQQAVLPVALALRTENGWQPGIIYFQNGKLLGFQVVSNQPADAGPPALAVSAGGDLVLAWSGLKEAVPHLYSASTAGKGLDEPSPGALSLALRISAGTVIGWGIGWMVTALITRFALRKQRSTVG
ncbi:MAG: hypothetical protein HY866_17665 [Chloroflexi bacterium]|nr:hypothetical protein [Chloroflexota bacterium]